MDGYLQQILEDINVLKAKGKKGLFRINEKMSVETSRAIENHFKGNPDYDVEIHRCVNCTDSYDIMISFRNSNV